MSEIQELVEKMRGSCFFCSLPIVDKKTQEHIIPNSLLGKLGIKEQKITGKGSFQYSRVKVPAHGTCNSSFGSDYENAVINLLDDTDKLHEELKIAENGIPIIYCPSESITMIISTWLSKIYYGLFYNDLLKLEDQESKETAKDLLDTENFRIVQNAYRDGVGFCLPSSLFVFKSNQDYFDLRTIVYPKTILIKINTLIMILCIEDGFLTKSYLNGETLEEFRTYLQMEEKTNDEFPVHLYSLSEILALRYCIPKTQSFLYSDSQITNMSLSNSIHQGIIDGKKVAKIRSGILTQLGVEVS
jgi:hypothetical protein